MAILTIGGDKYEYDPEDFLGVFSKRHPFNVPGPFYCDASLDFCSLVATSALSQHLLYNESGSFVWRQPCNRNETEAFLEIMTWDECRPFNLDGDRCWTIELVDEWLLRYRTMGLHWAHEMLEISEFDAEGYWRGKEVAVDRVAFEAYISFLTTEVDLYLNEYVRQLRARE